MNKLAVQLRKDEALKSAIIELYLEGFYLCGMEKRGAIYKHYGFTSEDFDYLLERVEKPAKREYLITTIMQIDFEPVFNCLQGLTVYEAVFFASMLSTFRDMRESAEKKFNAELPTAQNVFDSIDSIHHRDETPRTRLRGELMIEKFKTTLAALSIPEGYPNLFCQRYVLSISTEKINKALSNRGEFKFQDVLTKSDIHNFSESSVHEFFDPFYYVFPHA